MSLEANQFHLAVRMVDQIVTRSNSLSIDRETKQRLTMKLLGESIYSTTPPAPCYLFYYTESSIICFLLLCAMYDFLTYNLQTLR
jgi:hypothetical protein